MHIDEVGLRFARAAFLRIFDAQTESYYQSFVHARPPASYVNRWAVQNQLPSSRGY